MPLTNRSLDVLRNIRASGRAALGWPGPCFAPDALVASAGRMVGADAYVVVILGTVHLLDREGPQERQTFWEIFKGAAREWGQPATGDRSRLAKVFRVLAQCTHEEAGRMRELLPPGEAGPSLDIGGPPG
jgi:hypothetical protein